MLSLPTDILKGAIVGVLLVLLMFSFSTQMSSKTFGNNSLWDNVTDTFKDFFNFSKPSDNLEEGRWSDYGDKFVLKDDRANLEQMIKRLRDCYALGKAHGKVTEEEDKRVNCIQFCSEVDTSVQDDEKVNSLHSLFYRRLGSGPANFPEQYLERQEGRGVIDMDKDVIYQLYAKTRGREPIIFIEEKRRLDSGESCESWSEKEE